MVGSFNGCYHTVRVCGSGFLVDGLFYKRSGGYQEATHHAVLPRGVRALRIYVLLSAGHQQNHSGFERHIQFDAAYMGISHSVFFLHEKATVMKIIGIALGFGGAMLCILTQGSDDLARDAFTGNLLCMISSFVFAVYLIVSKKLLEKVGVVTMMKYIFGGAAVSGIIVSSVAGWDAPMFAEAWKGEWHWTAWAVLAFILIFLLISVTSWFLSG